MNMFDEESHSADSFESTTLRDLVVVPTAAAAIQLVKGWTDLSDIRRRDLISAIKRAIVVCNVPADALIMSCSFLNERFYKRSPAAFNMTRAGFGNIGTNLRFILSRLNQYAPRDRSHASLPLVWRKLHDALADNHRRASLITFMRYCGLMKIAPLEVRPDTVVAFEAWCDNHILNKKLIKLGNLTKQAWNKAVEDIPGWPQVRLVRPKARDQYSLPFETYPSTFQEDVNDFADRMAGKVKGRRFTAAGASVGSKQAGLRRHAGGGRVVKPSTIAGKIQLIKMAAGALVSSGCPPSTIKCLRDLVDPIENADAIFDFFWKRSSERPGSNVSSIARVLHQIALHHCNPPVPGAEEITEWVRAVTPQQGQGMTAKNRHRLQALLQPQTCDDLLHLPEELTDDAQVAATPKQAARLMLRAVAIEILSMCPMRIGNLRTLRLDENFRRLDPRSKLITHITIPAEDVKNGVPMDWPIPQESARLIQSWIDKYRPTRPGNDNLFLFPGQVTGAMSGGGLFTAITSTVEQRIGAKVHVHLFRHFAVAMFLRDHPGAYETARRILGHKSVQTTIRFYAGLEANSAAEQFDNVILRARHSPQSAMRRRKKLFRKLAKKNRSHKPKKGG
jgi:hypothetical protein